jgi:type IX secretion system PorP/SprF family membrane protein
MFYRLSIVLALALCLANVQLRAQDVHLTQFYEAPLWRNPALSGIFTGDVRVQAVFRDQWASVAAPFKTYSLNGEYKMPVGEQSDYLTIGGMILHDRAGSISFSTTHIMPSVTYHKALSENGNQYLSVGFMGGLVQRRIDRSKMTTNSQFDGTAYNPALADGETFLKPNYTYLDGSVGVSYSRSLGQDDQHSFYVGLGYHHFNRPKNSFYKDPAIEMSARYVASAGVKLAMNERSYFTFHGDYSRQGAHSEVIGGALLSYRFGSEDYDNNPYTFHIGSMWRLNDAIAPVVRFDYNSMSFGLAYDVNISALKAVSNGRGAYELSLTYNGFLDRDNSTKNAVRCPKF